MNVKNIIGRTTYNSGQFLGYILWKHTDGYHVRWSRKGDKSYNFQGKIICEEKYIITKKVRYDTEINTEVKNTMGWNTILQSHVDGFDFRTPGNFTVELKIKDKKIKKKKILLGPSLKKPKKNPFAIIQKIGKMKDKLISMPEPESEPTPKPESDANGEKNEKISDSESTEE